MSRRRYSSAASQTALTNSINNSVTGIVLDAVTGFPGSFPYELIIDYGTASEECVLVTAGTGTSLTVTRGYDGTTGLPHAAGAAVIHGVSAIDFDEANAHVNETTTAHGLTIANVATKAGAEVFTNKDLSSGTNTFPASLATDAEVTAAVAAAAPSTMPRGTLGYAASTTAMIGAFGADTDVTGVSTAVTVAAGSRRVSVRWRMTGSFSSVAGVRTVTVTVKDGATPVWVSNYTVPANTATNATLTDEAILTPSAGAHTYKISCVSTFAVFDTSPSATNPNTILVTDIGV